VSVQKTGGNTKGSCRELPDPVEPASDLTDLFEHPFVLQVAELDPVVTQGSD
jgi:hypothetical protein